MIEDLTVCFSPVPNTIQFNNLSLHPQQSFEDAEKKKKEEEEEENKPDPLTQLVTTFCRGAMTERSGALQEDALYMSYAQIAARSCGEEEEEGGEEEGGEEGESSGASIHVSARQLLAHSTGFRYVFDVPRMVYLSLVQPFT